MEQHQPRGLLEPLPIAERPWESVTMDFIISLPKSKGYGSIIVVVDRFFKYAAFIAAPKDYTAKETNRLFFTGKFCTELFKLIGLELHFSISFHPQMDGQTERGECTTRAILEDFVSANQTNWAKLLDVAQFSYNLQRSEATNKSPFEIVMRQQPMTPHTLARGYTRKSLLAYKLARGWHEHTV